MGEGSAMACAGGKENNCRILVGGPEKNIKLGRNTMEK
jgi:hypothetical protein